jgi:hypothetical protein
METEYFIFGGEPMMRTDGGNLITINVFLWNLWESLAEIKDKHGDLLLFNDVLALFNDSIEHLVITEINTLSHYLRNPILIKICIFLDEMMKMQE